jgi:hypothetical protein
MYASPTVPMKPRAAALRLIPLALALAISQAYGATPVGQTGLAGAHGASPGAAGGNGGNGGDGIASVVNGPSIEVRGGAGGAGGNGAAGTPNGAAGSGGNGGNAMLTTVLSGPGFTTDSFRVVGGDGGAAGAPGDAPGMPGAQGRAGNGGNATLVHELTGGDTFSTYGWVVGGTAGAGPDLYHGGNGGSAQARMTYSTTSQLSVGSNVIGGDGASPYTSRTVGGHGGDATLELSAASAQVSLELVARGGNGRDAQGGPGTSAGNGGTAVARLSGSARDSLMTNLVVQGGHGGSGTLGANGGHGADVAVSLPFDTSRTSGPIDITVTGQAGDGGSSSGGLAGRAGKAAVTLELYAPRASAVKVDAASRGGTGGFMSTLPGTAASAAATAGGAAQTDLKVAASGALNLSASAYGGSAARSWSDAIPARNGIAGSDAVSGIAATTDTALESQASAGAQGGDGGAASGSGYAAGKGGTGTVKAAVSNAGSGRVSVSASVSGGNGGRGYAGARGGDGGDARVVNAVTGVTNGELYLSQQARGGAAGADATGRLGGGGNAVSMLTLTDSRSSRVRASLWAQGGDGRSSDAANGPETGNAEAVLNLESTRAGTAVTGISTAMYGATYGGAGPNSIVARSVVKARGDAVSNASASRGAAYGISDAFARAQSAGAATAASSASGDVSRGQARSRAEAEAGSGAANATASASAADAQSVALGRGDGGTAAATSNSSGWTHTSIRVTASASAPVHGETVARAETNSVDALYTVDGPSIGNGARSSVSVVPTHEAAAAVFDDAAEVSAAFTTGRLFAVGAMEGASTNDGTYTYVSSANFKIASDNRHLRVGLFDAFAVGDGLQNLALTISANGRDVFSRTFASAIEARTYFDDTVLNLALGTTDDYQLLLSTSYTYTGEGAFGFGYVLGVSAVPEPATWVLMLAGLTVVLVRRKLRA